jgi:hypothetical protein
MIRTFLKETGLDDKESVSWIEEKRVSLCGKLKRCWNFGAKEFGV